MKFRDFSYHVAVLASAAFLVVAVISILFGIVAYIDWKMHLEQGYALPLIALFGVFVAALGTFSSVIFGWRNDRRQSKELKLKLKELESKLEETTKRCDTNEHVRLSGSQNQAD